MKSVYIETTIPSLVTSKPSRDMIVAGRQAATIHLGILESQGWKFTSTEEILAKKHARMNAEV